MKELTRNGISKNLSKSPYVFTEIIDGEKVDFNFSSKLHLNNFIKRRTENYVMIYNYINKRFKVKVDCRLLSDCNLYNKIESRGFYIKLDNKEFKCLDSITLSGGNKMKKNSEELPETSTIN